jgi:hypothetical protein
MRNDGHYVCTPPHEESARLRVLTWSLRDFMKSWMQQLPRVTPAPRFFLNL